MRILTLWMLSEILSNYGLLEHFGESPPPKKQPGETFSRDHNEINKSLFKDKKLAKLWEKAERSGFDEKELKVLKQEFIHHQDKIDEYYSILEREDLTNNEHSSESCGEHFYIFLQFLHKC